MHTSMHIPSFIGADLPPNGYPTTQINQLLNAPTAQ